MTNRIWRISVLLLAMNLCNCVYAEENVTDNPGDIRTQIDPDETHPIYSSNSIWVTSLLIGIGGLFLAAVVIGPIVRFEAPDAVPVAMSHEEDPAVDRH